MQLFRNDFFYITFTASEFNHSFSSIVSSNITYSTMCIVGALRYLLSFSSYVQTVKNGLRPFDSKNAVSTRR